MKLFQRIFFAAVLAGLCSGIAMSALQQWKVAPLILQAEVYEDAEAAAAVAPAQSVASPTPNMSVVAPGQTMSMAADAAAVTAAPSEHEHSADEWKPANGPERIAFTVGADLLAAMGLALVLAAVSTFADIPVTVGNGIIWGLCGFIVFHLAPAFGLPPELPGMPAAPLFARQVWWWGTALATGAAFLGIAKYRNPTAIAVGAVLILLPHIIGAPPIPEDPSSVPAHLSTSFAAAALTAAAVFWLTVGPLYGYMLERLARAPARAARRVPA